MGKQKLTTEQFIERALKIHGNKYSYDKSDYFNSDTKIKIVCLIHGEFEQLSHNHLKGKGCPKCAGKNKTIDEIIIKAKLIHGNKYDYSLAKYTGIKNKITIICPIHGQFEQITESHITDCGCPKCGGFNKTNNEFISDAKLIHGEKYDYTQVKYYKSETKINIICSAHGVFKQTPFKHLKGQGCPSCNESKGEEQIRSYLINKNINFTPQHKFPDCRNIKPLPFDFYLPDLNICIEFNGEQHYRLVKYFGGEKGFLKTKIRDKIKMEYCKNNNIPLIIIKYDESINDKLNLFI